MLLLMLLINNVAVGADVVFYFVPTVMSINSRVKVTSCCCRCCLTVDIVLSTRFLCVAFAAAVASCCY